MASANPEIIIGTCADVLTMENACFSHTQINSKLLLNEKTYRRWAHGTHRGD